MLTIHGSSDESSSLSSTISLMSSKIASTQDSSAETPSEGILTTSESSSPSSLSEQEEEQKVRDQISNDLKTWQEKVAKAADKGIEDLKERMKEISDHQIGSQVRGVGEALLIQLEESVDSETRKLKGIINRAVNSLPAELDGEVVGRAENEVAQAVRTAGLVIKPRAQSLRSWKQTFDQETSSLVNAASESTLDVINGIRDLGLQEIGMRWAWMEGVTYKDWAKYHALKDTFNEWHKEVETMAMGHENVREAKSAAEGIESRWMTIAEDAAEELARLKEVGMWKIHSQDSSEDFSTRIMPAKVALGAGKLVEKVQSAGGFVSETLEESTFVEKAGDASQYLSEAIIGSSTAVGERIQSSVRSKASKLSEAVLGVQQPIVGSVVSAASEKAKQAATDVTRAVVGTPAPLHESIISSVSTSASSMASQASKKVFAGAMAQNIPERVPIFDDLINEDDDTAYSERLQKIVAHASDKYADVSRAVSEALLKPKNTQASAESFTSLASQRYSQALAAASEVLYGKEPGTGESIASIASSRYAEAVAA